MRVLLLALLLLPGCATTFEDIDDKCIAGKFRADLAAFANDNPDSWKQHKDYAWAVKGGTTDSDGEDNSDRILNGDCSVLVKGVTGWIGDLFSSEPVPEPVMHE